MNLTLIFSICGIQMAGSFLNITELCPAYAAAAYAISNTVGCVVSTLFIQSLGHVLEQLGNTSSTWSILFGLIGVLNIVGGVIAWRFTDATVQEWALNDDDDTLSQTEVNKPICC